MIRRLMMKPIVILMKTVKKGFSPTGELESYPVENERNPAGFAFARRPTRPIVGLNRRAGLAGAGTPSKASRD
ncbi:MAG: hypothetical protein HY563_10150 [Ignavibacteriales bacterium]|nr:hypothetical protein [Ignavibacteriales bacterium]